MGQSVRDPCEPREPEVLRLQSDGVGAVGFIRVQGRSEQVGRAGEHRIGDQVGDAARAWRRAAIRSPPIVSSMAASTARCSRGRAVRRSGLGRRTAARRYSVQRSSGCRSPIVQVRQNRATLGGGRRRRGRRGRRSGLHEVESGGQPAVASGALGPSGADQRVVEDVRRRVVEPGEVGVGEHVVPGVGEHRQRLRPAPSGGPRPRRRGRCRRHRRADRVGEDLRRRAERLVGRARPGVDGHRRQQMGPEHPRQRESAPVLDRRQHAAP